MFLILATAFLDILGMSLFLPMLPSIIADFWVNPSWSGYTQAVYACGMFVGGLFFWKLSDIHGRKKILSFTSIINFLSYIIMLVSIWKLTDSLGTASLVSESIDVSTSTTEVFHGFTVMFALFLVARFVGWLGGSGFGVIQAYISDISSPQDKTRNMGLMGAAFGLAFLIGPALSGVLSQIVSIHTILILCSVIIALNVISIWIFLQEPKKHVHTEEIHLADFHFSHTVVVLLVLSCVATLAFSAVQSMSGQFYADRFHFDITQIGYTMAMVGFIAIVYQWLLIKHIRAYFNEVMMIRLAFLVLVIGFIWLALNNDRYILFFWIALFPIGMWAFNPSIGSLIAQKAGKEVGKVMWYNTSVQSIWQIFWPILAGMLYGINIGLPFLVSAGIFWILFFIALWGLS